MATEDEIRVAVQGIAWKWNAQLGVDPNVFDVYWIGRILQARFAFELPQPELDMATGIRVVETLERTIIPGDPGVVLRSLPPEQVGERAVVTVRQVFVDLSWVGNLEAVLTAALYLWCGCIGMAKSMRKTFVVSSGGVEASYTPAQRNTDYSLVRDMALRHPWVSKGMALARQFELSRGKTEGEIVDDWVPKDSPYWIR